MRTIKELCTAQALGAELLDKETPGWAKNIDLKMLRMADASWCILGQLYDSFHEGLIALELNFSNAPDYGFNARYSKSDYSSFARELEILEIMWAEDIAARQSF